MKISLDSFVKNHNLRKFVLTPNGQEDMNTTPCYAHISFLDVANGKNIMTVCADSRSEVDEIIASAEKETSFSTNSDQSKQISVGYRVKGTPFYFAESPESAEKCRRKREKIHGLQAEIDFEETVKNGGF